MLKNNKKIFIKSLHGIVDLLKDDDDLLNNIIEFLKSIDDKEYLSELENEKNRRCYSLYVSYGDSSFSSDKYTDAIKDYQDALNYTSSNSDRQYCYYRIGVSYEKSV